MGFFCSSKTVDFLRHFAYKKDAQAALLAGLQKEVSSLDLEWKPTTPVKPPLTDYRSDSQTYGKEGSEKVSNFTSVNILDMINAIGEEELQLILSDFFCPIFCL